MKSAEEWCNDLIRQLYGHGLIVNFDTRPFILAIQRDAIQAAADACEAKANSEFPDDQFWVGFISGSNSCAAEILSLLPEAKP